MTGETNVQGYQMITNASTVDPEFCTSKANIPRGKNAFGWRRVLVRDQSGVVLPNKSAAKKKRKQQNKSRKKNRKG